MDKHKPSQNHPNRKAHNWLVYDIGDESLIENCNIFKGHVYDLGCGEMPYKQWLLRHAETYTGVDWGNSLHDLKADIFADLNEPFPIENQVADTIISLSVLEHLREPQQFLNEALRILKPGGYMMLRVPFMYGVHEAPHDYYRFTCYGLEYMLKKAGFSNITVYPLTGFWVMWTIKFNYQTRRMIRGPWPLRIVMRIFMRFVWAFNQRFAPWLDKHWKIDGETAGYCVIAKKINHQ